MSDYVNARLIWLIRLLIWLPGDDPVKRLIVSLLNRLRRGNPGEMLYGCPSSEHTKKLQLNKRIVK